jgi:hypothetical protein
VKFFGIREKDEGFVRRGAWRLSLRLKLSVDSYFLGCFRLLLIMLLNKAEAVRPKKIIQKEELECHGEALKVFRKYRCHPVQEEMLIHVQ